MKLCIAAWQSSSYLYVFAQMNSRNKGARGEREAALALREVLGCEAERGVQRSGSPDSPDVKTSINGLHIEVKRVEKGNVHIWMEQAIRDAGDQCPAVLHRKNRTEWLMTVRLSDVPRFAALAATAAKQTPELGVGEVPGVVHSSGLPAEP